MGHWSINITGNTGEEPSAPIAELEAHAERWIREAEAAGAVRADVTRGHGTASQASSFTLADVAPAPTPVDA